MAMPITTSSFSSDLLPLITDRFGMAYPEIPVYYDKIMKVEKADDRNYQVDMLFQGFGLMQRKDEGTSLVYDSASQGYTPTYQHITYALGFEITLEMMEDGDAFKNAMVFTDELKRVGMQTKEIIAANVFNNAFSGSSTMTNGDGVSLVSPSHPTISGLQSNLITGGSVDLSEAAVEQMTIDIKNMTNARGIRIGAMPDKLLVSVTDEPTAARILGSPLRSGTGNNDLNYLRSYAKVPGGLVANPFFTSPHAFFMTSSVPNGVKFLVRKDLTMDTSNDFDTKNGKFSSIMRVSAGWSDFRGVIGSNGP